MAGMQNEESVYCVKIEAERYGGPTIAGIGEVW
jgi:hypothetical protein